MLKLHGTLPVLNSVTKGSYLVTVTKSDNLPPVLRKRRALLKQLSEDGIGYKAILVNEQKTQNTYIGSDIFTVSSAYDYLDDGDIIRLDSASGSFSCVFRKHSP